MVRAVFASPGHEIPPADEGQGAKSLNHNNGKRIPLNLQAKLQTQCPHSSKIMATDICSRGRKLEHDRCLIPKQRNEGKLA